MGPPYTAQEVAELLGLSLAEVRRCANAGFLTAQADDQGETRFSFQDLVLLRSAAKMMSGRIQAHRVRRALSRLREQLPTERHLSGVQVSAQGSAVVAQEGAKIWNALSGQMHLNFAEAPERAVSKSPPQDFGEGAGVGFSVEALYDRACALEDAAPAEAIAHYRQLLQHAPGHADARINLGRLLHDDGRPDEAVAHYRAALDVGPSALAAFNLGVALEDLGRVDAAIAAYQAAIGADAQCEDAYFNLARIYERRGERAAALRALRTYRSLTRGA